MNRNDIISAVKARLDELTPFQESGALLEEQGLTKPVEQYVDDLLDEATDTVRLIAPERRMMSRSFKAYWDGEDGRDEFGDVFEAEELGGSSIVYYRLKVPDDFLRIAEVRMGNWDRPCLSITLEGGEGYKLLRNPHTTAGPSKPAVVVCGGYLEFYGSRVSGVELFTGRYIDNRHYGADDNGMEQSHLVDVAIIWRCALLVLGVTGRADVLKQAEAFYVEAVRQLM